jgi:urease accessory protein
MIAVGLWGAQLGAPALWLLPVTFPMMMALGGLVGLLGVALPGLEVGIAASAVVLGLVVMFALRPPLAVAVALVAVFAIFHGHAHGTEVALDAAGGAYAAGFLLATALLHLAGIGLGCAIGRIADGRAGYRFGGSLVALAGLAILANII